MEARYAFRKTPLLEACQVVPAICEPVFPRVSTLFGSLVSKTCHGQVATQPAPTDVCSLLSDLERQNVEAMADRLAQSRLPLPGGLGWGAWDEAPWRQEGRSQVKTHVGQGDGVGSIRSF